MYIIFSNSSKNMDIRESPYQGFAMIFYIGKA